MSEPKKVVVTGMGMITPIGLDEKCFWQSLISGRSGIAPLRQLDVSQCKTRCGAEVDNAQLKPLLDSLGIRPTDRTIDMALAASDQALRQGGLLSETGTTTGLPIATIFGTGVGQTHSLFNAYMTFAEKGTRGMRPTTVPRCMVNALSAQISMRFKLQGTNYVIVSACSSATIAIGVAFRMIRDGYADMVLTGGSDSIFEPAAYGGWDNLGVMSRNPDHTKACRPFDRQRDGCILGEGAVALLMESLEHARRRKAPIRAEIAGYGESSDAAHITSPSSEGQARAMQAALESANLKSTDIGFINAHGTGTTANDTSESESIRMAFGEAADTIPVASNKSFFGHLLGAAGAAEIAATILSLENGKIPPNLNLEEPDPASRLCLVGNKPMDLASPIAMKNSFGFGGTNAVLVVRKPTELQ